MSSACETSECMEIPHTRFCTASKWLLNGYNWLLSACFSVSFFGSSINLLILFCTFFRKKYAKNRVVVGFSRHLLCSQVASDILQSLRALPLAVGRNTAGRGQLAIHETTATRHSNAQTIPRLFLVLLDCSLCSLTLPFRFQRRICFCNADTRAYIDAHHFLCHVERMRDISKISRNMRSLTCVRDDKSL